MFSEVFSTFTYLSTLTRTRTHTQASTRARVNNTLNILNNVCVRGW